MFYASDFLTATALWSEAEVAVHVRLLAWSWVNGPLPNDAERLGRISPSATAAWAVVEKLWPPGEDGARRNPSLEKYRAERAQFLALQKEKSLKAGRKRTQPTGPSTDTPTGSPVDRPIMKTEDEEENEVGIGSGKEEGGTGETIVEIWPTFQDWWILYDKSRDRAACALQWAKLDQTTHERIYRHTEDYVRANEKTYRKDPIRYLRNQGWNDEIISRKKVAHEQTPYDRARELAEALAERARQRAAAGDTY